MLITTANHDCSGLFRSYVTSSFQGIGRCLYFFATFFFFCYCQLLTSHPQSFQACNLCFYVVTLDVAIKYSCIFSYSCVINVKGFLPGPTLNPSRSLLYVPIPYCILFLNSCKALDFFLSWLMPCSSWELFSDSQYCKPQTHCEQVWAKPAFRLRSAKLYRRDNYGHHIEYRWYILLTYILEYILNVYYLQHVFVFWNRNAISSILEKTTQFNLGIMDMLYSRHFSVTNRLLWNWPNCGHTLTGKPPYNEPFYSEHLL